MSHEATRQAVQNGLTAYIPEHMHGGVTRYIERGVRPGDFLFFLLQGKQEAWHYADAANSNSRAGWGLFLNGCLPAACHGSVEKVNAWIEHDGLAGWNGE